MYFLVFSGDDVEDDADDDTTVVAVGEGPDVAIDSSGIGAGAVAGPRLQLPIRVDRDRWGRWSPVVPRIRGRRRADPVLDRRRDLRRPSRPTLRLCCGAKETKATRPTRLRKRPLNCKVSVSSRSRAAPCDQPSDRPGPPRLACDDDRGAPALRLVHRRSRWTSSETLSPSSHRLDDLEVELSALDATSAASAGRRPAPSRPAASGRVLPRWRELWWETVSTTVSFTHCARSRRHIPDLVTPGLADASSRGRATRGVRKGAAPGPAPVSRQRLRRRRPAGVGRARHERSRSRPRGRRAPAVHRRAQDRRTRARR